MYMHMESLYKVNGSLYMRVLRSGGKLKIPYTLAFVRGQEYIIYRQLLIEGKTNLYMTGIVETYHGQNGDKPTKSHLGESA